MEAVRKFLARKNIVFSARRYFIDAMGAMAQGLFCTLLVGTILNTIGQQLHIGFLTEVIVTLGKGEGAVTYTIGGLCSAMVGPGMAVAIGRALEAPPLVLYSLIPVGFATNYMGGAGGPLAVLFVEILAAEIGKAVSKQKKIDIVLTKYISRFARNTVDCLNYIRALRELGIAVIFEKENINTLEAASEILITMLGAFAQAESESISANVRWGKRQAMREGKTIIQYNRLYAYEKGEDGKPKIIQEQADVVRSIYDQYLSGASLRMIKDRLETEQIPNVTGGSQWTITAIRSILTCSRSKTVFRIFLVGRG